MRIKEIRINKLFGIFDHVIPLNMDERMTIITGENGVGKTITLKLIDEVFRNDFSKNLKKIPFELLEIEFDNNQILKINKLIINNQIKIYLNLFDLLTWKNLGNETLELDLIEDNKTNIDTSNTTARIGTTLSQGYFNFLGSLYKETKIQLSTSWFIDLIKNLNVNLIETERLIEYNTTDSLGNYQKHITVDECAKDLALKINSKLAEYANLAQKLDRTFPSRLIEQKKSSIDIKEKLKELEKLSTSLIWAGILEERKDIDFPMLQTKVAESILDESLQSTLATYIEDAEKKLEILKELYNKVILLKSIIYKRFSYKNMVINKDNGFIFIKFKNNEKDNDDIEILKPSNLSSGEQHELVMLYKLLFETKPNTLVMIDEPELSLHVAWQKEFLSDFKKIADLSQIDILIATHSPDIIDGRWDITVSLEEKDNNG